jgi:uncharacterized 2Fe-2S/4Fe-4S cluster protein (DUF4445 family)
VKIRLHNSSLVCEAAAGETILLACARSGVIVSAPCGGRSRCGKCRVRLLEGQVSGDTPDADGTVRACAAVPVSEITIACSAYGELSVNGKLPTAAAKDRPARAGIALDIGTTTVSARLVDLDTSTALDTISELNDQRPFGADVISRIGAAKSGKTGELFNLINRQTERIMKSFKNRWDIPKIEKLAVSANTTMLHFFLNVDPSGMGELPFTPVFLEERKLKGEALSLSVEDVIVLPSIAAFIGADISAGLTALDILDTVKEGGPTVPSFFIDVGTNGEMALCNRGAIYCCSTAAGPAFEGAEISCGIGGIKGAISGVKLAEGKTAGLSLTTIGNVPPVGICGSGLVDAMAVMLKQGIIDETGFMPGSTKEFNLAPGVSITGRDIRQFQLAKSAILSGIKILCKNGGLRPADIKSVFVAGGFGFYINKQNAVDSGIFPREFLDPLSVCGNLSLQGAQECLTAKDFLERCKKIISKCVVIDLAADPAFTDEFAENMMFQ